MSSTPSEPHAEVASLVSSLSESANGDDGQHEAKIATILSVLTPVVQNTLESEESNIMDILVPQALDELRQCLEDPPRRRKVKNWEWYTRRLSSNVRLRWIIFTCNTMRFDDLARRVLEELLPIIAEQVRKDRHGRINFDETIQEVAIALLKTYLSDQNRFNEVRNWVALAIQCTRSTIINSYRKAATKKDRVSSVAGNEPSYVENVTELNETVEVVQDAMKRLPAKLKVTLELRLDGNAVVEIATICGVPTGTVKTRLFAARRRIKKDPNVLKYFNA
jgi:RNA polymerase sigma factor (sigma-70 family)